MRIAVGLMIIVGALAVSGVAQAANWKVATGEQARPPAGTPKGTTLDAFFPSKLNRTSCDRPAGHGSTPGQGIWPSRAGCSQSRMS